VKGEASEKENTDSAEQSKENEKVRIVRIIIRYLIFSLHSFYEKKVQ
jgi:hypothetical protein